MRAIPLCNDWHRSSTTGPDRYHESRSRKRLRKRDRRQSIAMRDLASGGFFAR
jgi:hypothetical protein